MAFLAFSVSVKAQYYITTVVGNGISGYSGDSGPATAAEITGNCTFVSDASGNLYFNDYTRIRKINTSGVITTIAGTSVIGYSGDGGSASLANITPSSIAIDGSGNIYFVDYNNNVVRKINTSGIISTIAGNGTTGFSGDGGPATDAELSFPNSIAIDGSNNIYISDAGTEWGNTAIREINTSGIINTIAGQPTYYSGATYIDGHGFSGDGGPATSAYFSGIIGLAFDSYGNLYAYDSYNIRIRKISTSGIVSTITGNGTDMKSGDGGYATAATIRSGLGGIVIDGSNNIYLTDTFYSIRQINASGIINTIAGSTIGFSGDCGPATSALLNYITTIGVDGSGNLYVSDDLNGRIRKISLTDPNPNPGTITGTTTVCAGNTTTLSDGSGDTGGSWSSSNTGLATTDGSGVVTGVSAGNPTISYSVTNACGTFSATASVTVNDVPGSITGTTTACVSATTTLSNSMINGTWSSSNTAVATVSPGGGVVTGEGAGSATITYNTGCGTAATTGVTITDVPSVSSITGTASVCIGSSTALSDGTSGGSWSSSNTGLATVDGSGNVYGVSAGSPTISYSVSNSCGATVVTKSVTVNALPSISGGTAASVCIGSNTILGASGGSTYTWSPGHWVISNNRRQPYFQPCFYYNLYGNRY